MDDIWARLEAALVESAEALVSRTADPEPTWEAVLGQVTAAAARSVPGVAFAGMTMRTPDGRLVSRAPSHIDVVRLDRIQAELGEGPCVSALRPGGPAVVEIVDFTTETRWPAFTRAAVDAGMGSLLSHALAPRGAAPGAINFYAREPRAFTDSATRAVAGAFAMQAAIAVYGAGRAEHLTRALDSRDLIGRAKGILMERFDLDDQRAFDLLVKTSQDTNLKLVDVARLLSEEVTRRGRSGAPPKR